MTERSAPWWQAAAWRACPSRHARPANGRAAFAEREKLGGTCFNRGRTRPNQLRPAGLEHRGTEPGPGGFVPADDTLHAPAGDVWALGGLRAG